jgi:hypothetical protein
MWNAQKERNRCILRVKHLTFMEVVSIARENIMQRDRAFITVPRLLEKTLLYSIYMKRLPVAKKQNFSIFYTHHPIKNSQNATGFNFVADDQRPPDAATLPLPGTKLLGKQQ